MAENIANKDAAFECLEIARSALKTGDHARAEKFSQKALKLYRCQQTESMVLQVQVYISERTHGGNGSSSSARCGAANHSDRRSTYDQEQQEHREQPQHQQREQYNHSSQHQQQHQQQHHQRQHQHQQQHARQQHQQQQQHPRGMGGEGLRHRHPPQGRPAAAAPQPLPEDPSVTPEQRRLVQQILGAKSFYDILGVPRGASEADIKAAYRKLALRLHPDKNKANHADEAFKLLSKAFSCLSSPDKRAYYDRTGYENSAAAQAAAAATAQQRRGSGGGTMGNGSQFYYSGPDDFDPEEIFNMFFGAGAFGGSGARVFRSHFSHPAAHARARGAAQSRDDQQRSAFMGLMQLLPVLLVVGLTLFSGSQEPTYSLVRDASKFPHELQTGRLGVNYYVKDLNQYNVNFPPNTQKRLMVERQVESDIYERVFQRCQNERMAQHRAHTWGNRENAKKMELHSCKELGRMNQAMGSYNSRHGLAY